MSPNFNIRDFIEEGEMSESEVDRCEFWITANRVVRITNKANHEEARIEVNSNWNLDLMNNMLDGYHDKKVIDYLKFGWPLNAKDTVHNASTPKNQKGAQQNTEEIRRYLQAEIENGSIIGPFKHNPFGKKARFSPLDTRPKKDSTDLRVILNLSYPFEGGSVNSSIDTDNYFGEDIEVSYS